MWQVPQSHIPTSPPITHPVAPVYGARINLPRYTKPQTYTMSQGAQAQTYAAYNSAQAQIYATSQCAPAHTNIIPQGVPAPTYATVPQHVSTPYATMPQHVSTPYATVSHCHSLFLHLMPQFRRKFLCIRLSSLLLLLLCSLHHQDHSILIMEQGFLQLMLLWLLPMLTHLMSV